MEESIKEKYPSVRPDDKEFTFFWNLMIEEVATRKNFAKSHLVQFKIFCDCLVNYDLAQQELKENGFICVRYTDRGESIVTNPIVSVLNGLTNHIRHWSKMLGLVIMEEELEEAPPKMGEEDDWK